MSYWAWLTFLITHVIAHHYSSKQRNGLLQSIFEACYFNIYCNIHTIMANNSRTSVPRTDLLGLIPLYTLLVILVLNFLSTGSEPKLCTCFNLKSI